MDTRARRWRARLTAGALALASAACQKETLDTSAPASARPLGGSLAGDPAALQQDDGQWVMPAKNYAATRFSGLDEINTQNVRQLGVSWTFSTGMVAGHEAAPLGAAKGVACCDLVNRGAAYAQGLLFFNTLDGRTIALDAATGQPKWITQL